MITFENICSVICSGEKVTIDRLKVGDREGSVVFARHLIMYFAKKYKIDSEKNLGLFFGKDHSSVNHAQKAIMDYICTDKVKAALIDEYNDKILGVKKLNELSIEVENQLKPLKDKIEEIRQSIFSLQSQIVNLNITAEKIDKTMNQMRKLQTV